MTKTQNLHTHTNYVDGQLTAEEMILAAVDKGFSSIGFSEHSFVPFDKDYSMTPDATFKYIKNLKYLKEKYKEKIEVFIGLELDYYSAWRPEEGLDYVLGTAHYIKTEDKRGLTEYVCVDAGADKQKNIAAEYFDGDYYLLAEAYFSTIAEIGEKLKPDIIGHFDLIAKYNFQGSIYDEHHPRYLAAATSAMDRLLKNCRIFEVNTGAMYRLGKTEPYPSASLLKELCDRGGEVLLTSDSHDSNSLAFAFPEMIKLLKSCGFKHHKHLTKDGFVDISLS